MSGFAGIKRKSVGSNGATGSAAADLAPFRYSEVFADEHADQPTTVTLCSDDFWFMSGLMQLRRMYKYLANYGTGFAILSTPRAPNVNQAAGSEHICLLDLENFLRYFANPNELATHLQTRGRELMVRWRALNKDTQVGFRRPVFFYEDVAVYRWINSKKKEERSVFELQISTYHHTKNVDQSTEKPKIQASDLKLLIKIKTSVNCDNHGPDESSQAQRGWRQDGHG